MKLGIVQRIISTLFMSRGDNSGGIDYPLACECGAGFFKKESLSAHMGNCTEH